MTLYFLIGSQDLYGEETLRQVEQDGREMVDSLNKVLPDHIRLIQKPVIATSDDCRQSCTEAQADRDCIGVVVWMHTFSPAIMWIYGLQILRKPILHLHTQKNEKLPYDSIDMDFMNLNQSAHGDREFGFMCTRMGICREVLSGYYQNPDVIEGIRRFACAAEAVAFSAGLRVAMFGSNMRDVAVTDGDRVESQIRYGWNVNYYGIGDLTDLIAQVGTEQIDSKMAEYAGRYDCSLTDLAPVREQAAYEVALEEFLRRERIGAFTDTFQDLHGMRQLPGLAVQNLMAKGIGFGPEGDYKTGALMAVLCRMAQGRPGATAFLEDYTYDLTAGQELELAAHMLEVCPVFAAGKPRIEVHPLGIGGKEPPARLVFDGIAGDGIAVSMVDMGDRFRLICAKIRLVTPPQPMPALPVARVMWQILPDFGTGTAAWIYAGGAHHAVVSTALDTEDIRLFAKMTGTELVTIDEHTTKAGIEQQLALLDLLARRG